MFRFFILVDSFCGKISACPSPSTWKKHWKILEAIKNNSPDIMLWKCKEYRAKLLSFCLLWYKKWFFLLILKTVNLKLLFLCYLDWNTCIIIYFHIVCYWLDPLKQNQTWFQIKHLKNSRLQKVIMVKHLQGHCPSLSLTISVHSSEAAWLTGTSLPPDFMFAGKSLNNKLLIRLLSGPK